MVTLAGVASGAAVARSSRPPCKHEGMPGCTTTGSTSTVDTTAATTTSTGTTTTTPTPTTTTATTTTTTTTSSPSTPAPATAPVSNQAPSVSGTAVVGATVSASSGTWSGSPTSYGYQWSRCDISGANCAALNGATTPSYGVAAADVGATVRVTVTASNSAGSGIATSAATAVVSSGTAPTAVSAPAISGSPTVGSTLGANPGGWSGATTYAYQWTRCDSSGGSCGAITGANAAGYVPVGADVSRTLRVNVLATNSAGTSTATSAATSAVQAASALGSVTQPWFTSTSPFNTPIPTTAAVDPNSASWINQLYNNSVVNSIYVNQTAWSTTVYHANSTTPTIPIYVSNLNKHIDLPYLSGWSTSPDSDAHMVVIDDSTGCEYEFEALNLTSRWANSVAVFHVTTGTGAHAADAGVTGAGTSLLAGLITPQDVASGAINHALRIGTPINSSQFRLPATSSDGSLSGGIPEGSLIRLDPSLDLSQSGLTGFALMLAKALQTYGAYDGDNGGSLAVSAQVNGSYALPIAWLPKSMVLHLQVMAPLWTSVPTETNYTSGCHNPY